MVNTMHDTGYRMHDARCTIQDARCKKPRILEPFLRFLALTGIALFLMSGYAVACSVSTSAVSFGNYTSNQASYLNGSGTITVNCSVGTTYSIELNDGSYYGFGPYGGRSMKEGGSTNYLSYELYKDSSYSPRWGSGAEGKSGLSGTGFDENYTVYGRIPGLQSSPSGAYSDSIQVTVNFSP